MTLAKPAARPSTVCPPASSKPSVKQAASNFKKSSSALAGAVGDSANSVAKTGTENFKHNSAAAAKNTKNVTRRAGQAISTGVKKVAGGGS